MYCNGKVNSPETWQPLPTWICMDQCFALTGSHVAMPHLMWLFYD